MAQSMVLKVTPGPTLIRAFAHQRKADLGAGDAEAGYHKFHASQVDPLGRWGTLIDRDTNDPIVKPMFDAMKAKGAGPLNIHRTIASHQRCTKDLPPLRLL